MIGAGCLSAADRDGHWWMPAGRVYYSPDRLTPANELASLAAVRIAQLFQEGAIRPRIATACDEAAPPAGWPTNSHNHVKVVAVFKRRLDNHHAACDAHGVRIGPTSATNFCQHRRDCTLLSWTGGSRGDMSGAPLASFGCVKGSVSETSIVSFSTTGEGWKLTDPLKRWGLHLRDFH